jgi:hypothetical protein
MERLTPPFGGTLFPIVPPPDPAPGLTEFVGRAASARHEFFKRAATSFDRKEFERLASFVVHPDHLLRLNYEFKSTVPPGAGVYNVPYQRGSAPATVFGIPIKTDASLPVGKIRLRVEVEA